MTDTRSLDTYYSAIQSTLTTSIEQLSTEQILLLDATKGEQEFHEPKILVEFAEFEWPKRNTGKKGIDMQMRLHCILSAADDDVPLTCANMAAYVASVVHNNQWSLDFVGKPTDIKAMPGLIKTGSHGFDSWVVFFTQFVGVGDTWIPPNPPYESVLWSQSPEIGIPNKEKYGEITDEV